MSANGHPGLPPEDATKAGPLTSRPELLSYVPFVYGLGAILALSFDVGYFSAVNINWFTFFSLSEHLLFALEALPAAFALSFIYIAVGTVALRVINIRSGTDIKHDGLRRKLMFPLSLLVVTLAHFGYSWT